MDFLQYFTGVDRRKIFKKEPKAEQFGHSSNIHFLSEKFDFNGDAQLAILGVNEERGSLGNEGCALAADEMRKYLYNLYRGALPVKLMDLGNLQAGNSIQDTYFALNETLRELLKMNIIPIIIGGSKDLTYA